MKYKYNKLFFLLPSFLIAVATTSAQTNVSVPIGKILDSMSVGGITLPDGTVLQAESIAIGSATSPGGIGTAHGNYNTNEMGGPFNGNTDPSDHTIRTYGLTLPSYSGNNDPFSFTRISSDNRKLIDQGSASNYGNAIGFHIWTNKPIKIKQLLMLDCDGRAAPDDNQEWLSAFGYRGTIPVNPTVTTSGSRLIKGDATVNANWGTLLTAKIGSSITPGLKNIVRNSVSGVDVYSSDPDNIEIQALFDFDTSTVNHFFVLWGIRGNLTAGAAGGQNSGLSPLVFNFDFDFGDAPDSYGTSTAANGPMHVIPDVPLLTLGTTVTIDTNGRPSLLADTDTDDGVTTTIDSIHRRIAIATDTIATYSLSTTFKNNTGSTANYVAWIDWNNDGVFQASEAQTATSASGSTSGTVTFTWGNQALANHLVTNHTYARIRVTTAAITSANATNSTFQDGEVEDYYIPFADVSLPLPMHLLSFTAEKMEGEVNLKWTVADQKAIKKYEILKSSGSSDFALTGSIDVQKSDLKEFSFLDSDPFEGMNLYKLRSIDFEGNKQVMGNTLSVSMDHKLTRVSIFPNPAENQINVNVRGYKNRITLKVYSSLGQFLFSKTLIVGQNSIDITGLTKGMYYFKVYDGAEKVETANIEIK